MPTLFPTQYLPRYGADVWSRLLGGYIGCEGSVAYRVLA